MELSQEQWILLVAWMLPIVAVGLHALEQVLWFRRRLRERRTMERILKAWSEYDRY